MLPLECITDLKWYPAEKYVLIYERPDIFAQADPTGWQTALDILRLAEEYWQAKNIPLNIFLLKKKFVGIALQIYSVQ
jgi:Barstar (barnase inhibitor)